MRTKRYASLTLKKRYEIVCKLDKEKVNISKLARDLKIPRTTLHSLRKRREQIISEFQAGGDLERNRMRGRAFVDVEKPLLQWFCKTKNEAGYISGKKLLAKAREFARDCGYANADKLDMGWVNRWKVRKAVSGKPHCEPLPAALATVGEVRKYPLPTRQVVTETSEVDDCEIIEHFAHQQESDEDEGKCQDETGLLSSPELEALKTLDEYFRAQADSDVMLRKVSKMRRDILAREANDCEMIEHSVQQLESDEDDDSSQDEPIEHPVHQQESDKDENNCQDKPGLISFPAFSALEALKTLDEYFRTQADCDVMLCKVSKMRQIISAREACKL